MFFLFNITSSIIASEPRWIRSKKTSKRIYKWYWRVLPTLECIKSTIKDNRNNYRSLVTLTMTGVLTAISFIAYVCVKEMTPEGSKIRRNLFISIGVFQVAGTLLIAAVWYFMERWTLRGSNFNRSHDTWGIIRT